MISTQFSSVSNNNNASSEVEEGEQECTNN